MMSLLAGLFVPFRLAVKNWGFALVALASLLCCVLAISVFSVLESSRPWLLPILLVAMYWWMSQGIQNYKPVDEHESRSLLELQTSAALFSFVLMLFMIGLILYWLAHVLPISFLSRVVMNVLSVILIVALSLVFFVASFVMDKMMAKLRTVEKF